MGSQKKPRIYVLAGINGAGKSSVIGQMLMNSGVDWFNPDSFCRELIADGMSLEKANIAAWRYGRNHLKAATDKGTSFAFETTLGGETITSMLEIAATTHDVMMLYCGLESVDLHIARVAQRVQQGGHDIPEGKIRSRWTSSHSNLVRLMSSLAFLRIFDNSATVAAEQHVAFPKLLLEMRSLKVTFPRLDDIAALQAIPPWAKPMLERAIVLHADFQS